LIKAPRGCIEYVIIHELCHLIHNNHTQKFIDLQTKEMPDWEKWKMKHTVAGMIINAYIGSKLLKNLITNEKQEKF
jgi:predicted metal-dependent hydrolase